MVIALAFALGLREPSNGSRRLPSRHSSRLRLPSRPLVRDETSGMRAVFIAAVLVQLTFQTFTTWYALHGTERFGVSPEEVTTGFIAWAIGGVIGALPAGMIGVRIGRRNTMLLGFGLMGVCLVALHAVTTVAQATPFSRSPRPAGPSPW